MESYGQATSGQYANTPTAPRPETQLETICSRLQAANERLEYAIKRLHSTADNIMGVQPPRVEKEGGMLGANVQAQPSHIVFRINDALGRLGRYAEIINDAATRYEGL